MDKLVTRHLNGAEREQHIVCSVVHDVDMAIRIGDSARHFPPRFPIELSTCGTSDSTPTFIPNQRDGQE